ncbi:MAG: adenylate/guanylate cyclase domain-containing protein [Betaproteobacteria bacterium]|nr:adenylate/guanylate cyclase domain-containing protein [Betaproteobacteria bacterium]
MSSADLSRDVADMFLRAEQSGLKLAIKGRTVTLVLLGAWLVITRADDVVRALGYAAVMATFVVLGLVHYSLIATRFDQRWVKYAFVTLDIAIVSALVATQPLFPTAADLPSVTIFRAPLFEFYFVILGVAVFSFSPGLVLWTGVAGALGWLAAFRHVASGLDGVLNWSDIPPNPTAREVMAVVLDPNFGGWGSRIQEAILLMVVAALIALVMRRARSTLTRQLEAERDHATLSHLFGRFVPPTIAKAMIAGRGVLAPVEREATVLFADIAGFTEMTERAGAVRTVEIMNAFFDEVTRIVGDHDGIVAQFIGDAVLATFNVPVEDPRHAVNAFEAARAMLACVASREFAGERIRVRIGINTGPLVAGNVGGGGRQSYTVYGGTVNVAARLEALCKEHGTSLLVSAATARALPNAKLVAVGNVTVRGIAEPVSVFSIPLSNGEGTHHA